MRNSSATVHIISTTTVCIRKFGPQLFSYSLQIIRRSLNSCGSNSVNDVVRIPSHTNRTEPQVTYIATASYFQARRPSWMEMHPCRCTCVKWKTSQVVPRCCLHWLDVSSCHINRSQTVWFICSFLWADHAGKVCHLRMICPKRGEPAEPQTCRHRCIFKKHSGHHIYTNIKYHAIYKV